MLARTAVWVRGVGLCSGGCRGGGEVRSDLGVKELDVRVCIRVTHRMCVYLHGSTGVRGKYISFVRA